MNNKMEGLFIEDLAIVYKTNQGPLLAIDKVTFKVPMGNKVAILGPSGCGKSSVLKAISGLVPKTSGAIKFDSKLSFGYVPQTTALFNWKTVEENISFPLQIRNFDETYRKERVSQLMDVFRLSEFGKLYPRELSGGMKSRVAIARSLSDKPDVLLLDECFGNLDELTREALYIELTASFEQLGTTILFVTHSIQEAVFMADSIVVFSNAPGRIKNIIEIPKTYSKTKTFFKSEQFHSLCLKVREALEKNN
ncbi:ATP-binding cassette domain-containing protein [Aureisphaera galaxeae]|uniref:ABC transporter ATP-binding protein n=1 Tax=Aureisphaera galaxeae TaxID=1538023 RepID=UPI00234FE39C|nr:ATP-binding cassette domain-containing protein [Aureisphaera galaxeae]MDC8002842.1 ATP-binding cassette domain-containing protein [Aureisphaera galaxeae]